MPKLKVKLSIGYPTATHEGIIDVDDGEYADCRTDEQRGELLQEAVDEWAWSYIEISHEIVKE